jgi:hypothetical protein
MNTSTQSIFSFDARDLLESAVGLLHDYLIKPGKPDGRKRFKKLKATDQHFVAEMPTGEAATVKVMLSLDYSEFIGRLNFNTFKTFLEQLLALIAQALKNEEEILLRQEQKGQRFVISLPAIMEFYGQPNVLMLGLNLRKENEITLELLFFEPSQFEQEPPSSED